MSKKDMRKRVKENPRKVSRTAMTLSILAFGVLFPPILIEEGIRYLFLVGSSCIEDGIVTANKEWDAEKDPNKWTEVFVERAFTNCYGRVTPAKDVDKFIDASGAGYFM